MTTEDSTMLEPWNAVHARVAELRLDYWETVEDVAAMAAPIRWARNRREATIFLKEIAERGTLTSKSGLTARLRRNGIGKFVSSVAVHASFSEEAHYLAVANIDRLFSNAIEPWLFEMNPNKNNEGLKARHYLFAPLEYQGRIVIAKITVKEFQSGEENKLYSIEAVDLVQTKK